MSLTGWMLYTLTVSLLATAAAWSFEEGLTRARVPSRWVWAVALVVSVVLPVAALFPRTPDPVEPLVHASVELRAVAAAGGDREGSLRTLARTFFAWPVAARGAVVAGLSDGLDRVAAALPSGPRVTRWMFALWGWWSAALAGALAISALLIARQRRTWPRSILRGRAVRIAPDVGPAVVGVSHPEIVVPGWLLALQDEDLEMVLIHEEEHLRAGDPLLLGASLIPLMALPWNPAIWWQIRKLREAVEVDCDRRVLRGGTAAGAYGGLLVRIGNRRSGSLLPAPALASSHPLLMRRLQAMRRPRKGRKVAAGLAGLVSMGFVGLALGANTPTAAVAASEASSIVRTSPPAASGLETTSASEPTSEGSAPEAPAPVPEVLTTSPVPAAAPDPAPTRAVDDLGSFRLAVVLPPVLPHPAEEPIRAETRMELPTTRPVANPRPTMLASSAPSVRELPPQVRNLEGIKRALRSEYPLTLRTAGIGGTVQLHLLVSDGGAVSEARLAQSSGYPALDAAALRVAQTVQFTPASSEGRAFSVWTHLPITFQPSE